MCFFSSSSLLYSVLKSEPHAGLQLPKGFPPSMLPSRCTETLFCRRASPCSVPRGPCPVTSRPGFARAKGPFVPGARPAGPRSSRPNPANYSPQGSRGARSPTTFPRLQRKPLSAARRTEGDSASSATLGLRVFCRRPLPVLV